MPEATNGADTHLWIEECDATELVAAHGSPLYVMSQAELEARIDAWQSAMTDAWQLGPSQLLPSVKANLSLAMQHIVRRRGCGADTFGESEYEITRRVGFNPGLVSVNGQKTRRLIRAAITDGARLTVDNFSELEEIREIAEEEDAVAKIRLRVRPPLEGWDEPSDLAGEAVPTSTLMGIYKPGIPVLQLVDLTEADFGDNVELVGVHCHVARNTRDPKFWELAAREVMSIIDTIRGALPGWSPTEIDMGGGFPGTQDRVGQQTERVRERYGDTEVPQPAEYMASIVAGLTAGAEQHGIDLSGVMLEIEPGRALFGSSGTHLTTVMRQKMQEKPFEHRWVETDTSTVFFGVEEMNRWNIVVANKVGMPNSVVADVVGCSCQLDLIVPDVELPEIAIGDILAFDDAGAYQEAGGSNFNALARPAVVLVSGDQVDVIRRRESIDDVLLRDQVPARVEE